MNFGYLGETGMVTAITGTTGQETNFSYYGNSGNERLEQIQNLNATGTMISQFNYSYDAEGEITGWQQANSALSGTDSFDINYDAASQLSWVSFLGTSGTNSFSYSYDKAGNRTQEQINSATTTSDYNSLNQLTGQSPGGVTHFRGTLSKWATVTVGGNVATVTGTIAPYEFDGTANLATGTNTVVIAATEASGSSTQTNSYQVVVAGGTGTSLGYDSDGEMTNDGTGRTYQWDAANRLVAIWYGAIGSGSSTAFTYNGLGQRVAIIEKDASGNVTSTKQFVWCPGDAQPSEERDASDNVTKRFYPEGEEINGTNYYFTRDHLGSVREMTDATGNVQARYSYDLWGRQVMVSGTLASDFGYAGYYQHLPSGLNLTMFRAYDPNLARWTSRDPIGERGGINLYGYVLNNPTSFIDPLGLWQIEVYGGDAFAGRISFGNNGGSGWLGWFNGQWNLTAQVGFGMGMSASWDPHTNCQKSGYGTAGTIAGSLGNDLGGVSTEYTADSNQGFSGAIGGRLGPAYGGLTGDGNTNQVGTTWGASNYGSSVFAGIGTSWAGK